MGVGGFEAIGRLASGYAGGGFVLGQSAVEAGLQPMLLHPSRLLYEGWVDPGSRGSQFVNCSL